MKKDSHLKRQQTLHILLELVLPLNFLPLPTHHILLVFPYTVHVFACILHTYTHTLTPMYILMLIIE